MPNQQPQNILPTSILSDNSLLNDIFPPSSNSVQSTVTNDDQQQSQSNLPNNPTNTIDVGITNDRFLILLDSDTENETLTSIDVPNKLSVIGKTCKKKRKINNNNDGLLAQNLTMLKKQKIATDSSGSASTEQPIELANQPMDSSITPTESSCSSTAETTQSNPNLILPVSKPNIQDDDDKTKPSNNVPTDSAILQKTTTNSNDSAEQSIESATQPMESSIVTNEVSRSSTEATQLISSPIPTEPTIQDVGIAKTKSTNVPTDSVKKQTTDSNVINNAKTGKSNQSKDSTFVASSTTDSKKVLSSSKDTLSQTNSIGPKEKKNDDSKQKSDKKISDSTTRKSATSQPTGSSKQTINDETPERYKDRFETVHLCCNVPRCERIFPTLARLIQHSKDAHKIFQYQCPYKDCTKSYLER